MKNKFIAIVLTSIVSVMSMQTASADQGVITFTGLITSNSCTINGGSNNFNVTLPTVASNAFTAAGDIVGRTAFSIELTDCSAQTGGVHTYFEPGSTVDLTTGRLNVDSGGATGVQIALENEDFTNIKVGFPDELQNSKSIQINDGAATLNYIAAYYATNASVTPGNVKSNVTYTIVYE